MDQTSETREQDDILTSDIFLNKSASTGNETPSDTDKSERSASGDRIGRNESFNEQRSIDGLERSVPNINPNLSNNCISQEGNDAINAGGDLIRIENVNDSNNESTDKEKETDELRKSSDVDKLLENFINDSDIIDDSLLDISLGLLNLYFSFCALQGRSQLENWSGAIFIYSAHFNFCICTPPFFSKLIFIYNPGQNYVNICPKICTQSIFTNRTPTPPEQY